MDERPWWHRIPGDSRPGRAHVSLTCPHVLPPQSPKELLRLCGHEVHSLSAFTFFSENSDLTSAHMEEARRTPSFPRGLGVSI